MEIKDEHVERILKMLDTQNQESEGESKLKKTSKTIVAFANLFVFLIICVTTLAYGISAYKETVNAVKNHEIRMNEIQPKLENLDKLITKHDEDINILLNTLNTKLK
jgi:hypothetical protein